MDIIKIGSFIAECRKNKNLTQAQLAEKLNITDRAVSKWECGKSMPDSSIMLELCDILEINVNELLTGERLEMKDYNKQSELNLIELVKSKEKSDKTLLTLEIIMGIMGLLIMLSLVFTAAFVNMKVWLRILLIALGFIIFMFYALIAVGIEQKAGYYECQNCQNRYVPTYSQVLFAQHIGRTRYMKCPVCGKKTWQKKYVLKEE